MATIIRQSPGHERVFGTNVQPVAFSFADISGRAEDYLGEIRSKAGTIIAEAHEEAEKIRRRAEVAGRQAAEDAVERILNDKVASQMATLQPAIEQLVTQLNDARSTWQEHWDHAGVKLAVAIAHRILRREVEQDPALTLEFAREALEMATGASGVVLHLSPADFKNLGEQAARLAESIGQLAPTEIVADAAVTPGGCRVETRFGQIDMQLESQLARIEQELTD